MKILSYLVTCWWASLTWAGADMDTARERLRASHGSQVTTAIIMERLEYQSNAGDALAAWDAHAWIGGDEQKFWLSSEGELDSGTFEDAELQALYSKAISPFWDLQLGIRHDFEPAPDRTFAVVRAQGTTPYWFHIEASAFVSHKGDLSARLQLEYELRITQRLSLQPRLELNAGLSSDVPVGAGSGVRDLQSGLRLRYAIRRELVPYVGVSWSQKFGDTADLASDHHQVSAVVGIHFWF